MSKFPSRKYLLREHQSALTVYVAARRREQRLVKSMLAMADEWVRLSTLPESLSFADIAKASPAQRTLWEAAHDLRRVVIAHTWGFYDLAEVDRADSTVDASSGECTPECSPHLSQFCSPECERLAESSDKAGA